MVDAQQPPEGRPRALRRLAARFRERARTETTYRDELLLMAEQAAQLADEYTLGGVDAMQSVDVVPVVLHIDPLGGGRRLRLGRYRQRCRLNEQVHVRLQVTLRG